MARTWRPKKNYHEYPIRMCRFLNFCQICQKDILTGERYHDGGYSRRAHERCVKKLKLNLDED